MKVLERAVMPDGTKIQIEDWTEDYTCCNTLSMAAYPVAKNTGKYRTVRSRETFRLSLEGYKTDEDVKQCYKELESGVSKIEDFADKFRYGDKDKWYLGMDVEYKGW